MGEKKCSLIFLKWPARAVFLRIGEGRIAGAALDDGVLNGFEAGLEGLDAVAPFGLEFGDFFLADRGASFRSFRQILRVADGRLQLLPRRVQGCDILRIFAEIVRFLAQVNDELKLFAVASALGALDRSLGKFARPLLEILVFRLPFFEFDFELVFDGETIVLLGNQR